LIQPGSWLTASEVFEAWQAGAPVESAATVNMAIYGLAGNEVVLYLLGKEGNLFTDERFRIEAYNNLFYNSFPSTPFPPEFFILPPPMKQYVLEAIHAEKSTTVRYSGLQIKLIPPLGSKEIPYGYVEVGTNNTPEEKRLIQAVFGPETPGDGRKIYILRGEVIKQQLEGNPDDLIARVCAFSDDGVMYKANFSAVIGPAKDYESYAVWGIPK
ncbi:hypothetical protein COY95_00645, partial [Candidatus Woesearchaeota archaeon CG_4_10_14_0_8_um_filter_47_5]